jgi:hypothetical protein
MEQPSGNEYSRQEFDKTIQSAIKRSGQSFEKRRLSNQTIANWLEITPEEAELLPTWPAAHYDQQPPPQQLTARQLQEKRIAILRSVWSEYAARGQVPTIDQLHEVVQSAIGQVSRPTIGRDLERAGIKSPRRRRPRKDCQLCLPGTVTPSPPQAIDDSKDSKEGPLAPPVTIPRPPSKPGADDTGAPPRPQLSATGAPPPRVWKPPSWVETISRPAQYRDQCQIELAIVRWLRYREHSPHGPETAADLQAALARLAAAGVPPGEAAAIIDAAAAEQSRTIAE